MIACNSRCACVRLSCPAAAAAAPRPAAAANRSRLRPCISRRHASRQLRVAAVLDSHPEPAAAGAADEAEPGVRKEPNVVDWASLRSDIQANADANYLFDEGDDDDDEDEDVIYYRNRLQAGTDDAAELDDQGADGRWVERELVASRDQVRSPVPGSDAGAEPEVLVSAYTASGGFQEVGPEELHTLLEQQAGSPSRQMLVLDIRSQPDYLTGRAPGAYNVPFPLLSETVRSGLLDGWRRRTLVVLGDLDLTSAQASVRLRRVFGFESVLCVRGGMPAWMLAGLPYESGPDVTDWSEVFSSPV